MLIKSKYLCCCILRRYAEIQRDIIISQCMSSDLSEKKYSYQQTPLSLCELSILKNFTYRRNQIQDKKDVARTHPRLWCLLQSNGWLTSVALKRNRSYLFMV